MSEYPDLANALVDNMDLVRECPISLIHVGVWSGHVIESEDGVTLIDWEHSGVGHSVLDLSDAIVDCVDDDTTAALISGYEEVRSLKPIERDAIIPGAQLTIAIRVAKKLQVNHHESIPREIERFKRRCSIRL